MLATQVGMIASSEDNIFIEDNDDNNLSRSLDENSSVIRLNIVDFLIQVADTPDLNSIKTIKLKLMTKNLPLYCLNNQLPGLKELDLTGSNIHSLRELGAEMSTLQVLRLGACKLKSLDGIMSFRNLQELSVNNNFITDLGLLGHLQLLKVLDISRNAVNHWKKLSFLADCENLLDLRFQGNYGSRLPNYRHNVSLLLPQLKVLDDILMAAIIESGDGTLDVNDYSNEIKTESIPLAPAISGNISVVLAKVRKQKNQKKGLAIQKSEDLDIKKNSKTLIKAAEKWKEDFKNYLEKLQHS